jgi:hypothetical protein
MNGRAHDPDVQNFVDFVPKPNVLFKSARSWIAGPIESNLCRVGVAAPARVARQHGAQRRDLLARHESRRRPRERD